MNIAVRYYTRTGNTKRLAEAVGEAVCVKACDVYEPLTETADILFLGCSVYGGGVDGAVETFLKENASKIGCIVNFSSTALPGSAYKKVKKLADEYGIVIADDEFHCRGEFLFMHHGRPNSDDLKKAAEFAKKMADM